MGARRKPQSPTQEASNELQSAIGTAHGDELGKARGTGTEFQRASGTSGHGFLPVERSEILLGEPNSCFPVRPILQKVELASLQLRSGSLHVALPFPPAFAVSVLCPRPGLCSPGRQPPAVRMNFSGSRKSFITCF